MSFAETIDTEVVASARHASCAIKRGMGGGGDGARGGDGNDLTNALARIANEVRW